MVLHSRYGHTLCFHIRPHFRKCGSVATLKLHLMPHTAARPSGIGNWPYAKWPALGSGGVSRRRSPVVGTRPTRRRLVALVLCRVRVFSQVLRALFYSVACGQLCGVCPRSPLGLAAARLGSALNCPSAPRGGSLS